MSGPSPPDAPFGQDVCKPKQIAQKMLQLPAACYSWGVGVGWREAREKFLSSSPCPRITDINGWLRNNRSCRAKPIRQGPPIQPLRDTILNSAGLVDPSLHCPFQHLPITLVPHVWMFTAYPCPSQQLVHLLTTPAWSRRHSATLAGQLDLRLS